MQANDNAALMSSLHFQREVLDQHVKRRFRCAIGMPTAKAIVGYGADAGAKGSEHARLTSRYQGQSVLCYERRTDCVQRKDLRHILRVQTLEGPLRPMPIWQCQHTRGDNSPLRRIFSHEFRRSYDTIFVSQIECERGDAFANRATAAA